MLCEEGDRAMIAGAIERTADGIMDSQDVRIPCLLTLLSDIVPPNYPS